MTITELKNKLISSWIPKWNSHFIDNQYGGYHERLTNDFTPIDMKEKRLHGQCRQIYTYSHGFIEGADKSIIDSTHKSIDFLINKYKTDIEGGWTSSISNDGKEQNNKYDLYRYAFTILAFIFYYKATKDNEALKHAHNTICFIDENFRFKNGKGFHEELDINLKPQKKIRRQNPHMHLLEACLFAYEETNQSIYLKISKEIIEIFKEYFYDNQNNCLIEFFEDDLTKHNEQGNLIETGHHFEWAWLLNKYTHTSNLNNDRYITQLYDFASKYGVDHNNNSIYNLIDSNGNTIDKSKRIWHITEFIKSSSNTDDNLNKALNTLNTHIHPNGSWVEILNNDMTPQTNFLPSTTPYHITMGILESYNISKLNNKKAELI